MMKNLSKKSTIYFSFILDDPSQRARGLMPFVIGKRDADLRTDFIAGRAINVSPSFGIYELRDRTLQLDKCLPMNDRCLSWNSDARGVALIYCSLYIKLNRWRVRERASASQLTSLMSLSNRLNTKRMSHHQSQLDTEDFYLGHRHAKTQARGGQTKQEEENEQDRKIVLVGKLAQLEEDVIDNRLAKRVFVQELGTWKVKKSRQLTSRSGFQIDDVQGDRDGESKQKRQVRNARAHQAN